MRIDFKLELYLKKIISQKNKCWKKEKQKNKKSKFRKFRIFRKTILEGFKIMLREA